MPPWFETITDLAAGADVLRRRRYGVIEVVAGRLKAVRLRPFPKLATIDEVLLWGAWMHARARGDRCLLYYNQPRRSPSFLALKYVVSTGDARLATVRAGLAVLDEIARIKRSDAMVCDAANRRISDRLLRREGWTPHCASRWRRHYIKRFYGEYDRSRGSEVALSSGRPIAMIPPESPLEEAARAEERSFAGR